MTRAATIRDAAIMVATIWVVMIRNATTRGVATTAATIRVATKVIVGLTTSRTTKGTKRVHLRIVAIIVEAVSNTSADGLKIATRIEGTSLEEITANDQARRTTILSVANLRINITTMHTKDRAHRGSAAVVVVAVLPSNRAEKYPTLMNMIVAVGRTTTVQTDLDHRLAESSRGTPRAKARFLKTSPIEAMGQGPILTTSQGKTPRKSRINQVREK